MKINEFVEFAKNNKNKLLKEDQLQGVLQQKLEVKKYLSIKDKKQLAENIIEECILYEDGIYKFDSIQKYIYFTMKTIEAYTNLELSDDLESDYDMLCESMLLNPVINTFLGEYENVKLLLQMKCDDILSKNSIESQIGKFLDSTLESVDNISDVLRNKIKDFDVSKIPFKLEDLSKLMNFLKNKNT